LRPGVTIVSLLVLLLVCVQCASHGSEKRGDIRRLKQELDAIDSRLGEIDDNAASGRFVLGSGDYERYIRIGWRKRRYTLHVPPSYSPKTPVPLVLNLHGGGGRSATARLQTGMDRTADRAGFIVVYPDGTGRTIWSHRLLTWNAGECCGPAVEKNVDDVGFISAVLDDVASLFNIDAGRIYATGLSNGAMMAYRLACELSGRIAAIGPVAATMGLKECRPTRPVSVIHFHGTADRNSPFAGGVGSLAVVKMQHMSVMDDIMFWVKVNRCSPEPVEKYSLPNTTVEIFRAGDGTEVELVRIEGMGHGWPGGREMLSRELEGDVSHSINANDMMWDFFQRHPMPWAEKRVASGIGPVRSFGPDR